MRRSLLLMLLTLLLAGGTGIALIGAGGPAREQAPGAQWSAPTFVAAEASVRLLP